MCFTWGWLEQLLIWVVIVVAIVAILKLIVPYILSKLGAPASEGVAVAFRAVDIVIWAVIAIFVIYFVFALIACLWSLGGGSFPLFPHPR
jgi:hypothetical protein